MSFNQIDPWYLSLNRMELFHLLTRCMGEIQTPLSDLIQLFLDPRHVKKYQKQSTESLIFNFLNHGLLRPSRACS